MLPAYHWYLGVCITSMGMCYLQAIGIWGYELIACHRNQGVCVTCMILVSDGICYLHAIGIWWYVLPACHWYLGVDVTCMTGIAIT